MNNHISPSVNLSHFDADYARVSTGDEAVEAQVPDGRYETVIEEVRLVQTINNNPMLLWNLRILRPESPQPILRKHRVITDKTLAWVKEELQKCGVVLGKLSELPAHLDEMLGREVDVVKKTKDGKSNIYFQWRGPNRPYAADENAPF